MSRTLAAGGVITLIILAFGLTSNSIYQLQLMTIAGIFALAAIGLNLLMGSAGQISIGHAAFVGTGAYVSAAMLHYLKVPWLVAALGGTVAAALLGLIVGYAALRLRGHFLALATLAVTMMFPDLIRQIQPDGFARIAPLNLFGYEPFHPRELYFVVWALAGLAYLLGVSLLSSRAGRGLRALREDELAASVTGVDTAAYKIKVFILSSALAGFAGAEFASYLGQITYSTFTIVLSGDFLIMVVIGGLGSLPGAILGATFLAVVPEFGREYEKFRLTAYGLVLVLVTVFLPRGLAGLVDDAVHIIGRLFTRRNAASDAEVAAAVASDG